MPELYEKRGEGFSVRQLPKADVSNPRGERTWEWKMPEGTQVSAFRRLKDEYFANHFHKGDDPSKNPERFLLLDGVLQVEILDIDGNYSKEILETNSDPVELIIQPWILHRMKALQECLYVEYRKTIFNPDSPDTYPPEEFLYQFKD